MVIAAKVKYPSQFAKCAVCFTLLKAVKAVGGALTFNLPISETGKIPDNCVAQMQRLGRSIRGKGNR